MEPHRIPGLAGECEAKLLIGTHRDPLTHIQLEHFRQHWLTEVLDEIATDLRAPSVTENAGRVLDYFARDFALHEADEEIDLIPALFRHLAGGEGQQLAAQLEADHKRSVAYIPELTRDLQALAAGIALGAPLEFRLSAYRFAELWSAHVDWENRVVLPLARGCLTEPELTALGAAMARRRGIADDPQRLAA
jgi:hemerythrin-like domain-containing protein